LNHLVHVRCFSKSNLQNLGSMLPRTSNMQMCKRSIWFQPGQHMSNSHRSAHNATRLSHISKRTLWNSIFREVHCHAFSQLKTGPTYIWLNNNVCSVWGCYDILQTFENYVTVIWTWSMSFDVWTVLFTSPKPLLLLTSARCFLLVNKICLLQHINFTRCH